MRVWAWAKTQRPNCSFQYKTLVLWWVLESQIINADINYKVLEKPADVKNNANLSAKSLENPRGSSLKAKAVLDVVRDTQQHDLEAKTVPSFLSIWLQD